MQNRSNKYDLMEFDPIRLDEEFPITYPLFTDPPKHPHIHDCFEMGFCYEGGGVFLIEKKIYMCTVGSAVFINNREFHLLKNATTENTRWKFINLDPVKLLRERVLADNQVLDLTKFAGSSFCNHVKDTERPDITMPLRELIAELEQKQEGYQDIVRAYVWLIFQKLQRFIPKNVPSLDSNDNYSIKRIAPALHFISSNSFTSLRIKQLAEICNCSLSNFRKIFNCAVGCSPQEYLIRFRLNTASLQLINTDMQIVEISENSGFPTLSNFNRSFKKHFGMTPRQYRNKSKS